MPIEIIFQDMESFLKSEFHVGLYHGEKTKYTGASHKLYEIYRAAAVAPYFIGRELTKTGINLKKIVANTAQSVVHGLRNLKKMKK